MITGIGLGLGLLVGSTDVPTRVTTSLISGTRFSALALVIVGTTHGAGPGRATQRFPGESAKPTAAAARPSTRSW